MQNLQSIQGVDFSGKKVILRADLDVAIKNGFVLEQTRLSSLLPTLNFIYEKGALQILVVGHRGRPQKYDENLSLAPIVDFLKNHLTTDIKFIPHQHFSLYFELQEDILRSNQKLLLLDNLRFWPEEESNSDVLAQQLAYGMDIFVNDAFASSHRNHSSIVGVPRYLSSFAGLHFQQEVENLSKVLIDPKKPVIALISGIKKDKLQYVDLFKKFCDKILIAGRLPEFFPDEDFDAKLLVAQLNPDKEDITVNSIEAFEQSISQAGTIIVSGPPSHWEDQGHKLGTERVLLAISRSRAFKVAGGGDTTAAIKHFHLENSFDWISSGGGASLDFLANGTLPGIEAIINCKKT